ncbi:hypothetical protein, partial [uncultured Muribaculum sp.]|uniref:hypothetical protein n=1 Tax=uncultured Muribaculum sp. TaxID=1918613 RepID=UPI0025A681AF
GNHGTPDKNFVPGRGSKAPQALGRILHKNNSGLNIHVFKDNLIPKFVHISRDIMMLTPLMQS